MRMMRSLLLRSIYPAAPIHLLIIPRKHIDSLIDMKEEDVTLIGKMHLVANKLARNFQIDKKGFRTVINCGRDAGQAVYHIHLHLLGGQSLSNSFAAGARGIDAAVDCFSIQAPQVV